MTATVPPAVVADAGPRFTPGELAGLLRLPPPTREQAAVIAAPVEPLLVVAGAGSGKTETMAARVVWLVANAYVRPEQVLGLTFTRKAAGELGTRIRARLAQLVRRVGADADLLAGEPTVATYHSYAARIVTEQGLRAGYEPAARLLTEATRWQLADALVRDYDGDMSEVQAAPGTVTDAVLALAGELAEHLVSPDELAAWTGRFFAQVQGRPGGKVFADVRKLLARQQARLRLLPLVRAFQQRKLDLEALDFGDQLARAAEVARDHPEVGAVERDRFRVVLLDEYQDTSHAQVTLLRCLYGGGHPVTAVGDPCQSIYGWRGASAGTLDRFPTEFPRPDGEPAWVRELTTSWRNRPEILRVANGLSAPLRAAGARVAQLGPASRVAAPIPDVRPPKLSAAAGPPGQPRVAATVRAALLPRYDDEAAWIADRMVAAWQAAAGVPAGSPPAGIPLEARPTSAVLVRARGQIPVIEAALRARGLPVEVVGLGGLLDTPEVRDVVCTLRVLADPADGAALLRMLTGPRWRIGPRDLVALHRRARVIATRRDPAGRCAEPAVLTDRLDAATLVEALEELGPESGYSPVGHARLAAYAGELAALRHRLDQPLPDLVADVERTLGLDVEVAVRPAAGPAGLARGHLDAFGNVAARFATETEGATLSAFLAYLAAAEDEERGLSPGEVEVAEGAVQILTAHAAKGLEWDVVAVAGLTRDGWPGPPRNSDHYLHGLGVLPFPLRGDRDGLPRLRLDEAADQRGVRDAWQRFEADWREHDEREERRLAYVAVTRPRRLLLCSGYWWGEGVQRRRGPSTFLDQVYQQCRAGAGVVDAWTPEPAPDAVNPTAERVARASWPGDPLGARRPALEEAAGLVRALIPTVDSVAAGPPAGAEAARWRLEADLLLAERDRLTRRAAAAEVRLPAQLTVSQLVTLRRDPQALARALRRPMPVPPDRYARRGTAFHRWLEQRYGVPRLFDLDELPGAGDPDAAPDEALTELRERFLASEWAQRTPVEVEVPFTTELGGILIRGRIDAVFADPPETTGGAELPSAGGAAGYDVVDWKTGARPTGAAASAAAVQLAVYRLAWAQLAGVPVSRVRAAFHYVREGITERPVDLLDQPALTALLARLPAGSDRT